MKLKRDMVSQFSIAGAFIGLIYFFVSQNELDLSSLFFLPATVLYFSLLGMLVSIVILFFSDIKLDSWHFGVVFGYLFYLVASMLMYTFYADGDTSYFRDVIFFGPIPGFILQICLILLGLLLGLYLSNTDIVRIRVKR